MTEISIPPDIRAQVERFMADPERCMPSERERLKQAGFGADLPETPVAPAERTKCPRSVRSPKPRRHTARSDRTSRCC